MLHRNALTWIAALICLLLLCRLTVIDLAAGGPILAPPSYTGLEQRDPAQPAVPEYAKRCQELKVNGPMLWFATDEAGEPDIDEVVDGYPTGVLGITAGFEYSCVPPNTSLVVVFYALSYDEDPWFTEEGDLKPDPDKGVAYYPVQIKGSKPIPDGDYRAEFYLQDDLLIAGEVTVGGSADDMVSDRGRPDETQQEEQTQEAEATTEPTEEIQEEEEEARPEPTERPQPTPRRDDKVQIEGTISDGTTGRPIRGAVFVVLQPGITVAQWRDYAFAPSDILTTSETDRDGKFRQPGVERNVEYSVVAWALSYQGWYMDGFYLTDNDPDPYRLTIELFR